MTIPRSRYWGMLLAGGQGERLWPWSRRAQPKQFLPIAGRESLFQAAYARLAHLVPRDQIFVIGSAAHATLIQHELPRLSRRRLVAEPIGRNTAAAVGVGALLIGREDPGAVILVMTADQVIEPATAWVDCMRAAAHIALQDVDRLVCIGIKPTGPVTGYGYLVPGPRHRISGSRLWAAPLTRYVEKPPKATAARLIRRGAFWNSGMFVWSIPAIARALQRSLPGITRPLVKTLHAEVGTAAFDVQLAQLYRSLPSISIDYGVMEQAIDRWMVPAPFRWDDVGSWTSVAQYLPRDQAGNAVRGTVLSLDTAGTLIMGDPHRLIATIGVRDLIIVQHGDVIVVAHRSQAQQVKQLVARCQQEAAWQRHL